jgi:hypothetical protein
MSRGETPAPREPFSAHDALEDAALTRLAPPAEARVTSTPLHVHVQSLQGRGSAAGLRAYGQTDRASREAIGAPSGRRFPVRAIRTSASDGGRSHSPLRGSPGLAPGSLLTHPYC